MMSAAAMGATAFQKGLGAIHSLSHPIGALYDTHHGMTNAVFMPYVLAFNRDAIEEKIERLAAYCGIKGGFDGFAKAVIKLRKELKVPHTAAGLIKGLEMDKKRKCADRRHGRRRPDRRRQSGQADEEGGAVACWTNAMSARSEARRAGMT
jgi:alcohol dehydrogenase class IV